MTLVGKGMTPRTIGGLLIFMPIVFQRVQTWSDSWRSASTRAPAPARSSGSGGSGIGSTAGSTSTASRSTGPGPRRLGAAASIGITRRCQGLPPTSHLPDGCGCSARRRVRSVQAASSKGSGVGRPNAMPPAAAGPFRTVIPSLLMLILHGWDLASGIPSGGSRCHTISTTRFPRGFTLPERTPAPRQGSSTEPVLRPDSKAHRDRLPGSELTERDAAPVVAANKKAPPSPARPS